jgi:hypothetical protein
MCAARTRWVSFDSSAIGTAGDGNGSGCKGTRGYCKSTASTADVFDIGPTTNRLYLSIDGDPAPYITLYSGAELDARFVAKDITEKLHDLGKASEKYDNAYCEWTNDKSAGNCFKIYSGTLGSSSSVTVTASGTESVGSVLGFNTKQEVGGSADSNGFAGDASVSGTYYGFLDEIYHVVISNDTFAEAVTAPRGIATPTKGGANSYVGTMTTGGVFNGPSNITYTLAIDVANGTTMGATTGDVPRLTWTSTGSDSSTEYTELLYPDHWYKVGDYGLMVKFSDAVFNQCDPAWTIETYRPDYVQGTNAVGPVGTAQYVYSSNRGDMSSTPITTSSGAPTQLGTRGLNIAFNPSGGSDNFNAGDEFFVICSAPKPESYNITSMSYGNVTVSSESDVKCVMFEVESGAVELSTVKMGLQSHGTFSHHDEGNSDTKFRFGTVGPKNKAGASPNVGIEWYPNVLPGDIDSDIPPAYLYHTKENLSVVSTADDSESVGNVGLVSDPMWVNIRLGSSETGSNSTINMRLFFDYS